MIKRRFLLQFTLDPDIVKMNIVRFKSYVFRTVLISGICLFGVLNTFTVRQVALRFAVTGFIERARAAIDEHRFDDADEALHDALILDRSDERAATLLSDLKSSYITDGEHALEHFDYDTALLDFRSALTLLPDDRITQVVEDLESAVPFPRIFLGGTPLRAELFTDDVFTVHTYTSFPPGSAIADPPMLRPGDTLRVNIDGIEGDGDILVSFRTMNGKAVSINRAFRMPDCGKRNLWACFIALPSTLESGRFELTVSWMNAEGKGVSARSIVEISKRIFPEEVITLGNELTNLITQPDERKAEERKQVKEILASFNPDHVYEKGRFVLPVNLEKGRISSGFGDRRRFVYVKGGGFSSIHDGIDFGIKKGTPIFATAAGRIVLAREHVVSGNTIIIEHEPSIFSVYYHLSKIDVKEGELVMKLYKIGEVGSTGLSTAAHLHLSVFVGGVAVDPNFFFNHDPLCMGE
jgi:murein DD-endopeptidase MepM/ murein hydrolase activator NlpD